MAENSDMMNCATQQQTESEHADRRRPVARNRVSRVLPRHPIQRHCPTRKPISKRRKRRLPSITSDVTNQQPGSPNASGSLCSLSQSSTSSLSSPQSPPLNTTTKKRKYAVDKCDGRGETALHKAAIKGNVQKVKLLLRKGANPNHQDYAGWTPLHEACIRGWYHVAQALLKAGANANTPGLHNVTALHDATAWSHLSLVKLLLKYGANLTLKTDKGDTPVEVASAVVLNYLDSHGLVPESRARVGVPERTYEMRKSTYRSKVVKANSTDVKFKIKVRSEKGEDKGILKRSKKSKKKKSARISHSKKKMEGEEPKKEPSGSTSPDPKETIETESLTVEEAGATSSTSVPTAETTSEVESRRSSASLDDEDEGKRNKKRKEKEDHPRKEEVRTKEEHGHAKKEEHTSKKEDHKKEEHPPKKDEHTAPKSKSSSTNSTSPKSTTSLDGQDGEDSMKSVGSPGPKVPPLKIVILQSEAEQGSRNGKNPTARHHPYVVVSNEETSTAASTVTTSPSSPAVQSTTVIKEEPQSPSSNTNLSNEDQRVQQRVLRSTHSNKIGTTNSGSNGVTSGSNSSATSESSSPAAPELSPQTEATQVKEETKVTKTEPGPTTSAVKGNKSAESMNKAKPDTPVKVKPETEEEPAAKPSTTETRNTTTYHKEETSTVDLHPRKRKLKAKPEPTHTEVDHVASFSSLPHPHEVPVTNCYQMFMDIRRQIDTKRKGLFPIQPKPPQGFKDYLMNRCTYTLAGNSVPRLKRRNADPPEGISEGMRELYQEQEAERYSLRMQHIVEKEKLVLSVEQEILRVHGRAARALANQALPFSACTILKDEEVYNVITPEQEEKDRNARSRYNGRLFISWLQDVDDKWEKIKEEMLARHHKEAESLNAIQKFKWDLAMRQLGLWKKKKFMVVDESFVPMISVSDDFDLLPE